MARSDYELEDFRDGERTAVREWLKLRVRNIREHVSAGDVLTRNGVVLRKNGSHAEQISCPFHGKDTRPSAKYFPDEEDGHSHLWCYVCHENWDVIALWKKFTGTERFSEILRQLEREFGLTAPESPTMTVSEVAPRDPVVEEVARSFEVCERRLQEHRDRFDVRSHLRLGAILDHTRFYLENGLIDHATAKERLALVLSRIAGRVRAKAPADS